MTERLTLLLREEADALEIPPARPHDVLAAGRRLRTRHRVRTGLATAAVLVVAGGGAWLASHREAPQSGRGVTEVATSPPTVFATHGAFGAGRTLYVGDRTIEFDQLVKSVYYVDDGAVVRIGDSLASDGGGPSHYLFVDAEGVVTSLGITLQETEVPTFDAEAGTMMWVSWQAPTATVHVVDARTGEKLGTAGFTPDAGADIFAWPELWGDHAYVTIDRRTYDVDWRTGTTESGQGRIDELAGGVYLAERAGDRQLVRSIADRAEVGSVPVGEDSWPTLSPDGRYVRVQTFDDNTFEETTTIYDLAGSGQRVPSGAYPGWTADGRVLTVGQDGTASACAPTDLTDCVTWTVDLPGDGQNLDIRIGGNLNES